MGSLIRFELKKILSRRVMQVSLGVIFAMLCVITCFNITSQYALDPDQVGKEFEGTEAIAHLKENAHALAGPITDKGATEALREYKVFIGSDGEVKERYRPDRSIPGADAAEFWRFNATHGAYMSLLTQPWMSGFQMPVSVAATIDTSSTVDLYGQVHAKIASQLASTEGALTYTAAEKDFWLAKLDSVSMPVEYGYAGGWEDFLDLEQYLIFGLLAVVITCASVFNIEYREKTDAVLLSTRFGKTRLATAKVVAAVIVSSAIYWLMAFVLLVVPLVFFGAEGANLPIQASALTNTYSVSFSSASLICCLVGYLVMLGLLGITLLLSSRMRSSMGILAISVALVIVPLFVPNLSNNIANHVLFLFPYYALEPHNLFDMISYSIGPIVIEYPVMLSILFLVLFVAGSLLAARSFSKHQVA